ncbi:MAG: zinc ribbon domain-containing protein [Dehalococcoidia bacterium]|nr:zinc ribbon domain-containing protein [Dehalococcoidia bacterium]
MPIYEYQCPKCGTVYEETRRIEDRDKPVKCGKCGVNAVKIISGFASKTGFYLRPSAAPHRKAGG